MAALACDICGGKLKMDVSGEFSTCESCGMEHSKERLQQKVVEINGTVKVEGSVKVESVDFIIRAGTLEKYHGAATKVEIPDGIIIIGKEAFSECAALVEVIIPSSVKTIGSNAFIGCVSLCDVTIPNSVKTIGESAFFGCKSITSVTIPDSVEEIGGAAFRGCTGLKKVILPKGLKTLNGQSFWYCTSLSEIELPESLLKIEEAALAECYSLTEITVPKSVEYIHSGYNPAFENAGLTSIVIEATLWSQCKDAFRGTPFYKKSASVPDTVMVCGISVSKKQHDEIIAALPQGKIYAINLLRKYTGLSLYDSTNYIKELAKDETKSTPQKSGCYIATAVYGSYDAPQVLVLRQYRDNHLSKTVLGRTFIRAYYQLSPPIARWMKGKARINGFVRQVLDKVIQNITRGEA